MQWLIDIVVERVIAELGIPPVFIDRGDVAAFDWEWNNHLFFPAIFDLDLSGIVPSGASAVLIGLNYTRAAAGTFLRFRTKGNVNWHNAALGRVVVANIEDNSNIIVALNADRIIEANIGGIWIVVEIIVRGWWL